MMNLDGLKPGAVRGAADADAKRYERNAKRYAHDHGSGGGYEVYAFHRDHVRKAMRNGYGQGFDIIAEALKDRRRGLDSGKPTTRALYGAEELLQAAINLQRTANENPQSRSA